MKVVGILNEIVRAVIAESDKEQRTRLLNGLINSFTELYGDYLFETPTELETIIKDSSVVAASNIMGNTVYLETQSGVELPREAAFKYLKGHIKLKAYELYVEILRSEF